jgi:hypothetical protein
MKLLNISDVVQELIKQQTRLLEAGISVDKVDVGKMYSAFKVAFEFNRDNRPLLTRDPEVLKHLENAHVLNEVKETVDYCIAHPEDYQPNGENSS